MGTFWIDCFPLEAGLPKITDAKSDSTTLTDLVTVPFGQEGEGEVLVTVVVVQTACPGSFFTLTAATEALGADNALFAFLATETLRVVGAVGVMEVRNERGKERREEKRE